MSESGRLKDRLLGEPHGTASAKLRKALLFKYVVKAGDDSCHRCGKRIESVGDLSIEHRSSWQRADDPRRVFFDLDGIAFSHLKCNVNTADGYRPRETFEHGLTMYSKYGCRCEVCRAAKAKQDPRRPKRD